MSDRYEAEARELLTVNLEGRPEGTSVREAMYFQIRDALRAAHERGAGEERERCAKEAESHQETPKMRDPRSRHVYCCDVAAYIRKGAAPQPEPAEGLSEDEIADIESRVLPDPLSRALLAEVRRLQRRLTDAENDVHLRQATERALTQVSEQRDAARAEAERLQKDNAAMYNVLNRERKLAEAEIENLRDRWGEDIAELSKSRAALARAVEDMTKIERLTYPEDGLAYERIHTIAAGFLAEHGNGGER